MNNNERKKELMRLGIEEEDTDFYLKYLTLMKSIAYELEVAQKLNYDGDIAQTLLAPFRKIYSANPEFRKDILRRLNKCPLEDSVIDDYFLNMGEDSYSSLHEKYDGLYSEDDLDCLIDNADGIILNKIREHFGYENAC